MNHPMASMNFAPFEIVCLTTSTLLFGIVIFHFYMGEPIWSSLQCFSAVSAMALLIFTFHNHLEQDLHLIPGYESEAFKEHVAHVKKITGERLASLEHENLVITAHLRGETLSALAVLNKLHADFEFLSNAYMNQMNVNQEQADRIAYLEGKLQEAGQLTPLERVPFSAPAGQVQFSTALGRD